MKSIEISLTEKEDDKLQIIISGCSKNTRKYQKMLYRYYYDFAIGVCLRYAGNRNEAAEIMNKGFLKVFNEIHFYDGNGPFKLWLKSRMIKTIIAYCRINLNRLTSAPLEVFESSETDLLITDHYSYNELIVLLQQLPQHLRLVFNLYVIDHYTQDEICEVLGKSDYIFQFYLAQARERLKHMINNHNSLAEIIKWQDLN